MGIRDESHAVVQAKQRSSGSIQLTSARAFGHNEIALRESTTGCMKSD